MLIINIVSSVILAYLIGSIPSSVWIGRYFYGIDVRKQGSGNAGATNAMRILGLKAGLPVLIADIAKGFLSVQMAVLFGAGLMSPEGITQLKILLAIVTTIGHIFPVYVGFRGGKGVATLVGVILALLPASLLIAVGVFVLVFVISQYVSLASITAALAFPFIVFFVFQVREQSLILFAIMVALFVPLTHHRNIRRLLYGNENKFSLRKNKS
ncbi:MAG: glycerol-3-phosphate 1-O-acyltransferase PlsY [Bacteroidales bacterium]